MELGMVKPGQQIEVVQAGDLIRPPYEWTWLEYNDDNLLMGVSRSEDGSDFERCTQAGVLTVCCGDESVGAFLFVGSPRTQPRAMGGVEFVLDKTGGLLRGGGWCPPKNIMVRGTMPDGQEKTHATPLQWCIAPAIHALKLLNCQNVAIEPADEWIVEKRAARNMGVAPGKGIRYHTLALKLPKGRRVSFASMIAEERHYGLHSVRGHFKRYTAEAPLLGRYVGTWWWHPFMRGDETFGEIVKDYKIVPAEESKEAVDGRRMAGS
jgi:hypothetical protein